MINFNEKDHTYKDDNGQNYISVSKIVNKIFPFDTSVIKPEYLEMAIKRGNCLHTNAEFYFNYNVTLKDKYLCKCNDGKTINTHLKQFKNFLFYIENKGYDLGYTEKQVSGEIEGLKIAGTIDATIFNNDEIIIVDWKTTSRVYIDKWRYQLHLYKELYKISSIVKKENIKPIFITVFNTNLDKEYILEPLNDKELEVLKEAIESFK